MRLVKHCACGASIEVIYTAPKSHYASDDAQDRKDALDQVKAWDRLHKEHGTAAPSAPKGRSPE